MKMIRQSLIYVAGFVSIATQAAALPGFIGLLSDVDQSAPKACAVCHAAIPGHEGHLNVTPRGFELYAAIKIAAKANELIVPIQVELGRTDFAILGDTRTNHDAHRQVISGICGEHPEMVFHTGDMVADGSVASQWSEAAKIEACLIQPKILQHACGNHEGAYCTNNEVRRVLGNSARYYTVDFKGWTFVALDSNDLSTTQLQWLDALPAGKKYVPFFHHPPYPTMAGHSGDAGVQKKLVSRFKQMGVKLVLNGHNHGYDRAEVDGITYVSVGGGGAPLYPCGRAQGYTKACVSDFSYVSCSIDGAKITCVARLSSDGRMIDGFDVESNNQGT